MQNSLISITNFSHESYYQEFSFFSFFSFLQLTLFAQKEASNWFFGFKAGLNFEGGVVSPIAGSMITAHGCAVASDKTSGKLLFYTNGRNIWDVEHNVMPNGRDFSIDCPSFITQSALIVPYPGDSNLYYVFFILYTPFEGEKPESYPYDCVVGYSTVLYSCEIRYSIVDLRLNSGKGDVIKDKKNLLLQSNSTEKLTAIPHSNGIDFWLITHGWNSNTFYTYLISSNGIFSPNIINIGSVHSELNFKDDRTSIDQEVRGSLKASPDGEKLACAVFSHTDRPFDLFDFNPGNGIISNYRNLGNLRSQYGVSFSPNNTKLYITTDSPLGTPFKDIIRQYDLSDTSITAIISSGMSVVQDNPYTNIPYKESLDGFNNAFIDLQIALDGKIYASSNNGVTEDKRENGIMYIIQDPNKLGFDCKINYKRFNFGEGRVGIGLPNFIQSYFNGLLPIGLSENCDLLDVKIYPNPTTNSVRILFDNSCQENYNLKVFDIIGHLVQVFPNVSEDAIIDLSNFAYGTYIFSFSGKSLKRNLKVLKI